ncbi:STAS/SEC14 domain-containing protein [Pseudactinotalea sp. Z1732]|uniref:STAS/SEC14 domain-containing protein n=1 Tax=Pseudactinotalea sp. Z1732 TaxID=3413026 RepID=UPI003C7EBD97
MMQMHTTPEGLIEVTASGTVTEEDYEHLSPQIHAALDQHPRLRMLADLSRMEGLSPSGVKEDVKLALSRLGDLSRFERVAVLTDGGVVRALSKAGGALIPGVTVELFEPGQRQQALAWLQEAAGSW